MNITPNYNINYLRFNQRISNQSNQTEPVEIKNPAFKMNSKTIQAGAVAAAISAAVTGGLEATKNLNNKKEEKIPTREEFETTLDENTKLKNHKKKYWLKAFDKNPKNTLAFYYLEDDKGNRFVDDKKCYFDIDDIANSEKVFNNPELVREIINKEDENGIKLFSFGQAIKVAENIADYPNGFKLMMSIKDKDGDFRFRNVYKDFEHVNIFEEKPELAVKYANMKNETGYPRFDMEAINRLVELNNTFDAADIDNALELKRDNGDYLFDDAPQDVALDALKENPKEFLELCNIKVPNRYKYIQPDVYTSARTLHAYKNYPEETKTLLQMPHQNIYNQTRFEQPDINIDISKAFKYAPKSFLALSKIQDEKGNYRFSAYDIHNFLEDLKELDKETIKAINELSKIEYQRDGERGRWTELDNNQIKEGIEAYKKYPEETEYIIQHYLRTTPKYEEEPYIPTIKQVERFINDRQNFEFGLTKVEL